MFSTFDWLRTWGRGHKEADVLAKDYKKVLFKREKHRMESYGFQWTNTGWINIDNGTVPKDWGPQPLEVMVQNGVEFDRTYVYVYFDYNKSLNRLNNSDKTHFYVGNANEKELNMPKNGNAFVMAVAYKGDALAFELRPFRPGSEKVLEINVKVATMDKFRENLVVFGINSPENSIEKDLEYMKKFYAEAQRQKKIQEEVAVMKRLWYCAFPCLYIVEGNILFEKNCTSCHNKNIREPLTGPALYGVEDRWAAYPKQDLYRYIRRSQRLIAEGHPQALKTWNEWKPVLMNDFQELSDLEIEAILYYLRG